VFIEIGGDFDIILLCLQLIREQMVKSLEIIKDLEEQVKLVPMLKVILYVFICDTRVITTDNI